MTLESDFIAKLTYPSPEQMLDRIERLHRREVGNGSYWSIQNEIRPADLFCYLFARFGPPNGFQNLLRSDDSDNLIHWHWTLKSEHGFVEITGLNFRTDILFTDFVTKVFSQDEFCTIVKMDFKNQGKRMSEVRQKLESWVEFVNPYRRLRMSVQKLVDELNDLDVENIKEPDFSGSLNPLMSHPNHLDVWREAGERLHRAFGLCFGIRSMLPVMAEAFVNLVLFILMRPELKADSRLRDSAFKQHIDVRIRRLHLDCIGFEKPVDYSSEVCAKYHSLVNERNDLLHGNVAVDKLKFNDVYFAGTVPVFQQYRTMWHRAFNVQREAVGLDSVMQELEVVDNFIEYVLSCIHEQFREQVRVMVDRLELGLNTTENRVGVLFATHLVDMFPGPKSA